LGVLGGWLLASQVLRGRVVALARAAPPCVGRRLARIRVGLPRPRSGEASQGGLDILRIDAQPAQRLVVGISRPGETLTLLELPDGGAQLLAADVVALDHALRLQRPGNRLLRTWFEELRRRRREWGTSRRLRTRDRVARRLRVLPVGALAGLVAVGT